MNLIFWKSVKIAMFLIITIFGVSFIPQSGQKSNVVKSLHQDVAQHSPVYNLEDSIINIGTVLKLAPGPDNPRNSEGDFVTLKDGRILFIYSHFTGTSGDDFGNAYLAGRFSSDGGKTWSREDMVVTKQEGIINVMSVSLLRLHNGEIALFYLKINSMLDCIPMMRISTDDAETWSSPIQCISDRKGYFVVNNNRVIQLKNGRILIPVSLHNEPGGVWSSRGLIRNYYSDDNGRTWKPGNEMPNPDRVGVQEPGVVELKNGNILMFMRAPGGVQFISYSKDKGETWSAVERSNIKSPVSAATIARIPSTGDLLLVWNNNDGNPDYVKNPRTPLNTAVSEDEGKTWINLKTLENDPDGSYCYMAIHFTDDKNVLLAYCAGSQSKKVVWNGLSVTFIKRLKIDWIY